jgi:hypothetical protein
VTSYNPGDTITLEHPGGSRLVGEVAALGYFRPGGTEQSIRYYTTNGWTVTHVKPTTRVERSTSHMTTYTIQAFDPETSEFKTIAISEGWTVRVLSDRYGKKVVFETDDPEYDGSES